MFRFSKLVLVSACFLLLGQTSSRKKDPYDPDKLPPHEVACGRKGSVKSTPCKCMRIRIEKAEKLRLTCELIKDDKKRMECNLNAEACNVQVLDAEHAAYSETDEPMPVECSRSCTKARCECCHS